MTETKKEVKWETSTGIAVIFTVSLALGKTNFADGHNVKVDCCDITTGITLDGKTLRGWLKDATPAAVKFGAVKQWGKLGIVQGVWGQIQDAISEIKTHPSWIAKEAKEAKNLKECEEYEAHKARVDQMMSY